jgi:hypothetical protein
MTDTSMGLLSVLGNMLTAYAVEKKLIRPNQRIVVTVATDRYCLWPENKSKCPLNLIISVLSETTDAVGALLRREGDLEIGEVYRLIIDVIDVATGTTSSPNPEVVAAVTDGKSMMFTD